MLECLGKAFTIRLEIEYVSHSWADPWRIDFTMLRILAYIAAYFKLVLSRLRRKKTRKDVRPAMDQMFSEPY